MVHDVHGELVKTITTSIKKSIRDFKIVCTHGIINSNSFFKKVKKNKTIDNINNSIKINSNGTNIIKRITKIMMIYDAVILSIKNGIPIYLST